MNNPYKHKRKVVTLKTNQAKGMPVQGHKVGLPKGAVRCKYCDKPTLMDATKLCDGCWSIRSHCLQTPDLVRKILKDCGR